MINRILVALDFSARALVAFEQGLRLGTITGAEVCTLHVGRWKDTPTLMPLPDSERAWADLVSRLPPAVGASIDAVRQRFPQVKVTKMLVDGDPARGIEAAATHWHADIVAVGTHGRTGFEHFLLGSVAERVVRSAPSNVLVARPDDNEGHYRRILVPTDYSESAQAALDQAIELVADDGQIELFHAWQPPHVGGAEWDMYALGGETAADLQDELSKSSQDRGAAMVEAMRGRTSAQVVFQQTPGRPAAAIQKRLGERAFDLVLMGSHGRKGVKRWLLGSVAEMTVRYARCSVLVMHSHSEH